MKPGFTQAIIDWQIESDVLVLICNVINLGEMKKFRSGLIAFAMIIIVGQLFIIDFKDLSWQNNAGAYLGIISMILLIISMIMSIQHDKREKNKNV